jgi:uncharacterized membrane protein YphA (DoxX/SURF4 family)
MTRVIATVVLTSAYFLGGVTKLANFKAAVAEQLRFGLRPGWLWASLAILVELVAPILLVFGRFVWLAAGALGVLTAISAWVADDFWNRRGQERLACMNTFFEHMGLIAGFALVAVLAEYASL